jgi:capsid protein
MTDIQSSMGRDPEELFEELSREKALADQYGIETAFSPYGATKTPVEPDLTGEGNE